MCYNKYNKTYTNIIFTYGVIFMKKAFTMLELIMVIVIIGILAAVIMPRTGSNKTAEAAVKLISDIRYTQHLAMIDDKFDATDPNWYKNIWQIRFGTVNSYYIVSDNNLTLARDPIDNSKPIQVDLNDLYGVTLFAAGGCVQALAGGIVGFDHIGRPIVNDLTAVAAPYTNLMTQDCNVTIRGDGPDVLLILRPETGYISMQ